MNSHKEVWTEIERAIWKASAWLLLFSFIITLCTLAIPIYSLQIFDKVLSSQSRETLYMLLIATILAAMLWVGLDHFRRRIPELLCAHITLLCSRLLLERQQLTKKHSKVSPIDKGTQFLQELQSTLLQPTLINLTDALLAPVLIFALYAIHPVFSLFMLSVNACYCLLIFIQNRNSDDDSNTETTQNSRYSLLTSHQMHRESIQLGFTQNIIKMTDKLQKETLRKTRKISRIRSHYTTLSQALKILSLIVLPTLGANLLISQQISSGMLLAVLMIGSRCFVPYEALLQQGQSLQKLKLYLSQLQTLLEKPFTDSHCRPLRPMSGKINIILKTSGLSTSQIMHSNLEIKAGERVILLGAHGSGVQSLLDQVVGTAQTANLGHYLVFFDNFDCQKLDRQWLGQQLGYACEPAGRWPISISEYLSCYNKHQLSNEDQKKALLLATQQVGIDRRIESLELGFHTPLDQLTESNERSLRLRLALARACYQQPRYLIINQLDGHCDSHDLVQLCDCIDYLQQLGITVIIATHRRSLIQHAHKVLLMERHKILFFGRPSDLPMESKSSPNIIPIHSTAATKAQL